MLTRIGHFTRQQSIIIFEFFSFLGWLTIRFFKPVLTYREFAGQIANEVSRFGFKSIFIICIVSFLLGTVITSIAGGQFQTFGITLFTVNLLGISQARALAPLVTVICLIFLGAARFTNEVSDIDSQNTDLHQSCLNKILAMGIIAPMLSLFAFYAAAYGGAFIAVYQFRIHSAQFWQQFFHSVPFYFIVIGLFKAIVFGIEAATIGCFYGMLAHHAKKSLGSFIITTVSMGVVIVAITDSIIEISIFLLT